MLKQIIRTFFALNKGKLLNEIIRDSIIHHIPSNAYIAQIVHKIFMSSCVMFKIHHNQTFSCHSSSVQKSFANCDHQSILNSSLSNLNQSFNALLAVLIISYQSMTGQCDTGSIVAKLIYLHCLL